MCDSGGPVCAPVDKGASASAAINRATVRRRHGHHRKANIQGLKGHRMNRHLKRVLELLLVPVAAAIVFIEETLIRYLSRVTAALARLEPIARLEAWLKTLPPWAAVLAFAAPSLILMPVKLATLWFLAIGRPGLALVAVVLGKMIGTAIVARLYRILHPALSTLPWFVRADTWFFHWRDRIYAFVRSLPAWQQAAELVRRWRLRIAALVSGFFAR